MKKLILSTVAVVSSAAAAVAQEAATPIDLSGLEASVDFSTVTPTIIAIAGTVFGVMVLMKGIRFVRQALN